MKRPRLDHLGLLAGLFLAALALRPQLVGVGPLIPKIQEDLDVSHAIAGLLGTIPVFCMGVFAPPGPYLAQRLGSRAAISACLATIAVFGVALDGSRLSAPEVWGLVRFAGFRGGFVHRLLVTPDRARAGLHVRAVLKPEGTRTGAITDIRGFSP